MGPKKMKAFGLILAGVTVLAFSAASAPASEPDIIVQQRQQDMKAMANAAKTIDAMFKGSSPYNAKAFKDAAETIGSHSGERLSSLFDRSIAAPGSKASASIGPERQKFDKLAADLGVYASALSSAADRNPDVLGPQMRMQAGDTMMGGPLARKANADRDVRSMPAEHAFHLMLQTCTSCHAEFRARAD
ncbi:cytochrome c [Ensifer sp. IC4062]|nr:cytochrome c [Ensifer sp. IC4062]MCA1443749.1 cytochrome c [Ensifer sp. IC4062]